MPEPLSKPSFKRARVQFRLTEKVSPLFQGKSEGQNSKLTCPFYSSDIPQEYWNWTVLVELASPLEVGGQAFACDCLIRPLADEILPYFVQGFRGHLLKQPFVGGAPAVHADFEVLAERFSLHPDTISVFFACLIEAPPSQLDPELRAEVSRYPFREKPLVEAANYLQSVIDNHPVGNIVLNLCNLKRYYIW